MKRLGSFVEHERKRRSIVVEESARNGILSHGQVMTKTKAWLRFDQSSYHLEKEYRFDCSAPKSLRFVSQHFASAWS